MPRWCEVRGRCCSQEGTVSRGDAELCCFRQQTDDAVSAGDRQTAIKRNDLSPVTSRQTEQITVSDLLACIGRTNFRQNGGRDHARPPRIITIGHDHHQQAIRGGFRRPLGSRKLRADSNDAQFGHRTGGPSGRCFIRKPIDGDRVMLMLRHQQRHKDVHIE
jgi:hypothetical protein